MNLESVVHSWDFIQRHQVIIFWGWTIQIFKMCNSGISCGLKFRVLGFFLLPWPGFNPWSGNWDTVYHQSKEKKCIIQWFFSIFTEVCTHSIINLKTFSPPTPTKGNPYQLEVTPNTPSHSSSPIHWSSLSTDLSVLNISHCPQKND